MHRLIFWIAQLLISSSLFIGAYADDRLGSIKLPPGFQIKIYASDIPNARSLSHGPQGTVFVGTRKAGNVYAVRDIDQDNESDRVLTIATGLNMPNGVAYFNGSLYVAEVNRVLRFDKIAENLHSPPAPIVVNADFPSDRSHGWKYIAFGPDGMLYVPVGAPCNICESKDPRYATLMRMNADGSQLEIYAKGIRNTVGFDWHPESGHLWFSNNGRDWMGDDLPPDSLHRVDKPGLHFGFPYCHAGGIADPEFGHKYPCDQFEPPVLELPAHVAPLGIKFYRGSSFPAKYRERIFIAEHGSWNRSTPVGYRITTAAFRPNRQPSYEVFAEGWLNKGRAWGRPVDILIMPDGAILVSDDKAGAIYRISYR